MLLSFLLPVELHCHRGDLRDEIRCREGGSAETLSRRIFSVKIGGGGKPIDKQFQIRHIKIKDEDPARSEMIMYGVERPYLVIGVDDMRQNSNTGDDKIKAFPEGHIHQVELPDAIMVAGAELL